MKHLTLLFTLAFLLGFHPLYAENQYRYHPKEDALALQAMINPPEDSQNSATWIGADVASSIEVTPNKFIWLFGDTLLGKVTQRSRYLHAMLHNSVAIMTCQQHKKCQMTKSASRDIFILNKAHHYFWPTAGTLLNTKLFITGYVIHTHSREWIPLSGTCFILVHNIKASPTHWQYTTYLMPDTNAHLNWATAAVKKDDWLYIFGSMHIHANTPAHIVLSRIQVENAETAHWTSLEYWSHHHWTKKLTSPNALDAIPGLPGTSEMSLGYNDYIGWYTVSIPALTFDIHLYTAKQLTGPWQDQGIIYHIPRPIRASVGHFIAYAAKVHPELATTTNEIVLTYTINQLDTRAFVKNIEKESYWWLYIPQFVTVEVNFLPLNHGLKEAIPLLSTK